MSDNSRIPRTIDEFNKYLASSDKYQLDGTPTNFSRFGWSALNSSDWHDKKVYWADTLFPLYGDPMTSTTAVKGNVKLFIEDFHVFGNPLLNLAAASSVATHDDEVAMNFKIGRHEPTHRTVPLSEKLILGALAQGGGDVRFTGRTGTDASRPSKPAGSDSMQLAFMLQGVGDTPVPVPPQPDPDRLPSPDSSKFTKEILTHASMIVHFGTDNQGKILIAAARWFNTKHPELAGSWSSLVALMIS
jgi:hypothetical protein